MKTKIIFLFILSLGSNLIAMTLPSPDFMAITDNPTIRVLESNGLSLNEILNPAGEAKVSKADNATFYHSSPFKKVVDDIGQHLEKIRQGDSLSGVGMNFNHRLFDTGFLKSELSRFVLVGAVLRMDRAFSDPDSCGEFRLLFRLSYRVHLDGEDVASRLPMAVNLVFNAKNKNQEPTTTCQDVARRWQKPSTIGTDTAEVANYIRQSILTKNLTSFANLKQVEINLQSVRWPSVINPTLGGHAEYLLKIYRWNSTDKEFQDQYLEDQIDTEKIAKDSSLKKELLDWILKTENLRLIDDGLAVIPEKFLAKQAISVSPGGARRIQNRPFLRVFNANDFNSADFTNLQRIRSTNALLRRLDDHSCTGCHQQKSIAGFHFIGKDPEQKYPLNSSLVAGSPHFLADQPRRREIVNAFLEQKKTRYDRGFAERTDATASVTQLKGTGLIDGWGARCSLGQDPSYAKWNCAEGFECRAVYKSNLESALGICYAKNKIEIGDYCESGTINSKSSGSYSRNDQQENIVPQKIIDKDQRCFMNKGGFPGGIVWQYDCSNLPKEAACALLPSKKAGFNACLGQGKNFVQCIRDYSSLIGLRRCDDTIPCRDDFLCIQADNVKEGVCVPPYFLFQFRVDGHPLEQNSKK